MRAPFIIASAMAFTVVNFSSAQGIDKVVNALEAMPGYSAHVEYAITLPQSENDVVYHIDIQQPDTTDSYLIDWSVMSPSGSVEGFTAWFDGHFYNFRNRRLQEYHENRNSKTPQNNRASHNSVQFSSLLPSRIAMQLREVAAGGYTYEVKHTNGKVIVEAVRHLAGEPDAELTWTFHGHDLKPMEFYADYNPGAITGQQVTAIYSTTDKTPEILSEAYLRGRYPEAFSRYRESQFAIENMKGERLPAFSLPKIDGGRLSHQPTDGFDVPTLIALIDPESSLAPNTISAIRGSLKRLPFTANIIWACANKNPAVATNLLGKLQPEETAVTAAGSLAMDCGVAALPVIMLCGTDGIISDLIIGMNNTLQTDVLQMLTRL